MWSDKGGTSCARHQLWASLTTPTSSDWRAWSPKVRRIMGDLVLSCDKFIYSIYTYTATLRVSTKHRCLMLYIYTIAALVIGRSTSTSASYSMPGACLNSSNSQRQRPEHLQLSHYLSIRNTLFSSVVWGRPRGCTHIKRLA